MLVCNPKIPEFIPCKRHLHCTMHQITFSFKIDGPNVIELTFVFIVNKHSSDSRHPPCLSSNYLSHSLSRLIINYELVLFYFIVQKVCLYFWMWNTQWHLVLEWLHLNVTVFIWISSISTGFQGAPEGLLERCTHVRIGANKVPMSPSIKNEIMKHVRSYGTG